MTDNKLLDPTPPSDEDDDYSDHICSICRTGGDMICCDGRCLRSFHPKCIGLHEEDIPEDSPFVCSDCFSGVQRCFTCCHFGLENELIKCSVKYCGKFYHPECVKTLTSSGEDYICKLHSCDSCGEVVTNPMKRKLLWRCFRCPKAFDSKHRPRDVHVLAEGLFLCIRHTQEEEIWPEMSKKLADRLEKRNQQSADWAKKNSNGLQIANGRNISLLEKQETSVKSSSAYRPGESEQQRQKRLKKEEKERLDNEATIRASSIMPKKRQSTESDEDRRDGSDYDEDEPCFSPASAGGDDGHSNPLSDNHRNLNSPPLSHLARHNEYRRQRKGLWNQSWNQYRDIQDEAMGIRRRGDPMRGQFYDHQDYYSSPLPSGISFPPSQYSFTTSNSFPGNGAMDRTNTMLLSSTSSPYTSYPSPAPGPPPSSYDDLRRLPASSPPSSTTFLTRTNALLSQLTDTNPTSINNFPSEGQNKRVKHDHSFDPYASSPSYSSTLSSVPPAAAAGSVNGYSSHRSHDYTSPIGPNYSTGSRIDTNTNFAMSASSSSSGSRVPLSSSTGVLSRTEQLLAKSSSSLAHTAPFTSSSFSSSSSRPMLSRTEQILAMTSNHQPPPPSRPIPRNQPSSSYHSSSSAPKTSKAQDNKMEATDLFAMLQASGLLPTK